MRFLRSWRNIRHPNFRGRAFPLTLHSRSCRVQKLDTPQKETLSVTIGAQLGSYELLGLLGKGGMGEVYRARDRKLKREVAIKILPDEFSHDPDRLSRFHREAEVLASLNHPNIASIYDLQAVDNGSRFLVLELVEGETLAERIKRGPIPVDESLNIAKSICEALEAAHEKGVIHRDLKPANIKITPDGKVKVLDFGLAKAIESAPTATTQSNSPTLLNMAVTTAGVILGTAAYMSPEQAKGKAVDKRADIWAFGVVVYEMLTGRMLFSGGTASETMAAVMMKEPDWDALPGKTPASIRDLLRRCLNKEARSRLQAIGDARLAIEETVGAVYDRPQSLAQTSSAVIDRRYRFALTVLLVVVALLAIPAAKYFREAAPAVPREMRTDITTPPTDDPVSFALSPDGQQLVFVASGPSGSQLWLRPLAETTAQPLPATEGASFPFWSPDSRSVGFFAAGRLKRLDIGGGLPQTLANASLGQGGTWGPKGVILFSPSASSPTQIFRIPASGGEPEPVTMLAPSQTSHRFPQFLPDGRSFLFQVVGDRDGSIYLGSLDTKETKRVTAANSTGFYDPLGWLFLVRQGTLVAEPFDLSRKEIIGDPVTVADTIATAGPGIGGTSFALASGLLAYRAGTGNGRQLTWFDRSGKVLGTLGPPDFNGLANPALSPDGSRVAVDRRVQGNSDIWLLDGTHPFGRRMEATSCSGRTGKASCASIESWRMVPLRRTCSTTPGRRTPSAPAVGRPMAVSFFYTAILRKQASTYGCCLWKESGKDKHF
jgi:eukaryotic-like serine/threonine-protein kinase